MQPSDFKVSQIDHVDLFVPDRYEAARFLSGLEDWAVPGGPLMISSDGRAMLALFEGEPRGSRPTAGYHRVAFRVDGSISVNFLQWGRQHSAFSGW